MISFHVITIGNSLKSLIEKVLIDWLHAFIEQHHIRICKHVLDTHETLIIIFFDCKVFIIITTDDLSKFLEKFNQSFQGFKIS